MVLQLSVILFTGGGGVCPIPLDADPPGCRPPPSLMQTPSPWMQTPSLLDADPPPPKCRPPSPWMQPPQPPWMQTPPEADPLPPGCRPHSPWMQTPLEAYPLPPPPEAGPLLWYDQQAGGTHPTGMLTCMCVWSWECTGQVECFCCHTKHFEKAN